MDCSRQIHTGRLNNAWAEKLDTVSLGLHLRQVRDILLLALLIGCALAGCASEKKAESPTPVPGATVPPSDTTPKPVADSARAVSDHVAPTAVPVDTSTIAEAPIDVRLVDRTQTDEYDAYKVEVKIGGKIDTIPGVLTFDMPVTTADGVLHGPIYTMDGEYRGIYSYEPRTRAISEIALPPDAARWDSEVKLSPDGAHIAYMGGDSTGEHGIIRTWPAVAIVLKTPSASGVPGDYSFNQVRWATRDSVAFSWRANVSPKIDGSELKIGFVRVYTSLSTRRFAVDTLQKQPVLRDEGGDSSTPPPR